MTIGAGHGERVQGPLWSGEVIGTIVICFVTAVMEGFGLQSVGVAAHRIVSEYHLSPSAMGWVASASTIGLLPGAVFGGRIADFMGRKRVLLLALILSGIFTLATATAQVYQTLLLFRFFTGLGLGAALPNLIALSAEAARPGSRSRFIAMMYCGVPGGGAVAAFVSLLGGGVFDWRWIFYVGGFLTLAIIPFLIFFLPESAQFRRETSAVRSQPIPAKASTADVLFHGERGLSTTLLWLALFFHMLVIYLLLNWLPLLLVDKGLSVVQAATVQIVFNMGGVAGNLLFGQLMDKVPRTPTAIVMYCCFIAFLAPLAYVHSLAATVLLGFAIGVFALGGQMVLYAMVPVYYPTLMRGTGVGWSVGVGRIGSFAGPVLVGQALRLGFGPSAILIGAIPALTIAAFAILALLKLPQAHE